MWYMSRPRALGRLISGVSGVRGALLNCAGGRAGLPHRRHGQPARRHLLPHRLREDLADAPLLIPQSSR